MTMKTIKKIISSLLVASMAFTMTATPTHAEQKDPYENLIMNKSSSYDPNTGDTTITLEAYAEGKIVQSTQPTDIVLVLDVSGSMDESMKGYAPCEVPSYWDIKGDRFSIVYKKPYFVKYIDAEDGNKVHYLPVRRHSHEQNLFKTMYHLYVEFNGTTYCFGPDSRAWKDDLQKTFAKEYDGDLNQYKGAPIQYYESVSSKMNIMKEAIRGFLDVIDRQNANGSSNNRVSIVKFAGNKSDKIGNDTYGRNDYNHTQIVSEFTDDLNGLKSKIDELIPGGATRADYGLQHASDLLAGSPVDKNKVVVFFTDGEPTSSNTFEKEVANSAVTAANGIKNMGAKIYSIGMFDDADPSDDSKNFNKYMHRVSSNYIDASDYENGTKVDSKYYLAARNADALNEIFGKINEDIQSNSSLNETTILRDVISDSFKEVADVKSVKTYVADAKSVVDGRPTFGDRKEVTNLNVSVSGKTVDVSGFDYNGHAVVIDRNGQIKQGKKLIVEIKTKPKDGFIGGNGAKTNDPNSGIVVENKIIKNFNEPTVDVDIKFDYSNHNGAVYAGSDFTDLGALLNLHTYKNNRNDSATEMNYPIDGINNKYVNIEYSIYAYDESKENPKTDVLEGKQDKVASYMIPAAQATGEFKVNGFNANALTKDQKYVIQCNISPVNSNGTIQPVQKEDHLSTVYVVKPTVALNDDKVFLGNTSDLNKRVAFNPEMDWSYDQNAKVKDGAVSIQNEKYTVQGNKALNFSFVKTSGTDDRDRNPTTFTPNTAEESKFSVVAKNGKTDISEMTKFNNDTNKSSHVGTEHNVDNEFNIDVVSGKLIVNKKVEGKYDEEKTKPIFTFKIEKVSKDGNVVDVEYRTIDFRKNDSFTLDNLEAGQYKITELKTLRFELKEITNNGDVSFGDPAVTEHKVTATNAVKSNNYFSDNGYIVNKFKTENGHVKVEVDK